MGEHREYVDPVQCTCRSKRAVVYLTQCPEYNPTESILKTKVYGV